MHVDASVKKELLRFKLRDERDFKKMQKKQEDDLNKEVDKLQPSQENDQNGDQTKSKNQDAKSAKPTEVKGGESVKNEDKISMGTIGMDAKSAMEPEASDEEK